MSRPADTYRISAPTEFSQGKQAAEKGIGAYECPYNFLLSGCLASKDQDTFEREFRPKMNAWFAGWKSWLDEHGLNNKHKPIKR